MLGSHRLGALRRSPIPSTTRLLPVPPLLALCPSTEPYILLHVGNVFLPFSLDISALTIIIALYWNCLMSLFFSLTAKLHKDWESLCLAQASSTASCTKQGLNLLNWKLNQKAAFATAGRVTWHAGYRQQPWNAASCPCHSVLVREGPLSSHSKPEEGQQHSGRIPVQHMPSVTRQKTVVARRFFPLRVLFLF